ARRLFYARGDSFCLVQTGHEDCQFGMRSFRSHRIIRQTSRGYSSSLHMVKRASIKISHLRRRLPRGQTINKIVPITKAEFLQPPRYHVGRLVELTHSGAIDVGLKAEHRKHLKAEGYKS